MKVIITGGSGLLGSACCKAFASHNIDISPLALWCAWKIVRSRCADDIAGADLVIHAAANTDVEQCEVDPDSCYRDNYLLTDGIASACASVSVPLVFISSTGVYGEAQITPYHEYAEPRPTTHHHRAKLLGEQAVLGASPHNLVIRTGWLFGGALENPKNFIARRLEEAANAVKQSQSLFSNSQQRGCPTFTGDVAERLILLIQGRHSGLFNVVNEGNASRLEYVRAIVEAAGLTVPVKPASASTFNRRAKVSANEMALNWRAREIGLPDMFDWRDSLSRYIRQLRTINEGPFLGN